MAMNFQSGFKTTDYAEIIEASTIGTAMTVNAISGKITTSAVGALTTLSITAPTTVSNNRVGKGSVIVITDTDALPTSGSGSYLVVMVCNVVDGAFDFYVQNTGGSTATTILRKFNFYVLNPV